MIEIRRIMIEDIPALSGLYYQFWGEVSPVDTMQKQFIKLESDPDYIFLGAVIDEELAGSVTGIICGELYGDCRPFIVIEDLIVDKNHRRKGIGRMLMNQAERIACARNCCRMILVTDTAREDAVGFYTSLGFNPDTHRGFKKSLDNIHDSAACKDHQ